MEIKVSKLSASEIEKLNIYSWAVWSCDESEFDWEYDEKEVCLLLEGSVEVSTESGNVKFSAGDYVEFPQGLKCHWKVTQKVRKHFKLG